MNQHQLFAPSAPVFDLSAWSDEARLQEQQKRDEALARLLDRSESQEREKASIQEEQDARLALQLLVEEKNRLDREKELELVSEKVAQQLQLDLALAQRWQEDVCSFFFGTVLILTFFIFLFSPRICSCSRCSS
eukprot:TRINITY_DN2541_c0_g1_i1.p1 TRINITY_DN2541_c0_g1~~TRINITY_DN2541_c0_g1_i1.p1  ORF type:complete len:134 (+),score=31.32 TRINITY_DN2541_c0_g1_i1:74-475(+)